MAIDYTKMFFQARNAAQEAADAENKRLGDESLRGFDCGFAWVHVETRHPFVNWCKAQIRLAATSEAANVYGSKGYPTGWQFWCPCDVQTQSITVFQRAAEAFAEVLKTYNVPCGTGSRYD